jgi:hypothetical protein
MSDPEPLRQVTVPCSSCGSWYRRGDRCNLCGQECQAAPEVEHRTTIIGERSGRQWSSKLHRYLTEAEIKAGKRGG